MSGFEIAGIVLAVVPLIWDAIKDTPETSVGKGGHAFINATAERQEFADELLFAHNAIRKAMLDIFLRINIFLTDSQRKLVTDPNTMGANFMQVWNAIYDANSAEVKNTLYTTIEDIRPVLETMEKILIEMVSHTKISSDEGREKLRNIVKMDQSGTLSITKHLRQRFRFAKSHPHRLKLMKSLKKNVKYLNSLVETQAKSAALLAEGDVIESQKQSGQFLEKIRGYSENLHDALSRIWNCQCHTSRSVMLKLEKREAPTNRQTGDLRFSLILTSTHSRNEENCDSWTFCETDVSVNSTYISLYIESHS
jgi:polyhydroxyalkanoate synthesis regulator phasin